MLVTFNCTEIQEISYDADALIEEIFDLLDLEEEEEIGTTCWNCKFYFKSSCLNLKNRCISYSEWKPIE